MTPYILTSLLKICYDESLSFQLFCFGREKPPYYERKFELTLKTVFVLYNTVTLVSDCEIYHKYSYISIDVIHCSKSKKIRLVSSIAAALVSALV